MRFRRFVTLLLLVVVVAVIGRVAFPDLGIKIDAGTTYTMTRPDGGQTEIHCLEGADCYVRPYERNNGLIVPFGLLVVVATVAVIAMAMRSVERRLDED